MQKILIASSFSITSPPPPSSYTFHHSHRILIPPPLSTKDNLHHQDFQQPYPRKPLVTYKHDKWKNSNHRRISPTEALCLASLSYPTQRPSKPTQVTIGTCDNCTPLYLGLLLHRAKCHNSRAKASPICPMLLPAPSRHNPSPEVS